MTSLCLLWLQDEYDEGIEKADWLHGVTKLESARLKCVIMFHQDMSSGTE